MAVTFDAVGPSSSGASSSGSTTLSWAHTVSGPQTVLVAAVALDASSDAGMTMTCTCNGAAMTSRGTVESGGGTSGFLQVWTFTSPVNGSNTIQATVSGGTPGDLTGGSISFNGAASTFGTPATGQGASITASAATGGSTSGGLVAGFVANGDPIISTTSPSTSRFLNNFKGGTGFGTGNIAGATSPSTGSAVTMSWGLNNAADTWAVIAVEVLPAAVTASSPNITLPGRTWLRQFRRPQFSNQQPPGPVMTQANPVTATATGAALQPQVITVSAAAAPFFNPGKTWRRHFQWPQQQQLSGPPPLQWVTAGLATATATANGPAQWISGLAGSGAGAYFVGANGVPRLLVLEQAWALPSNAGRWNSGNWQSDMDTYFSTRATQGHTAWYGIPWSNNHVDGTAPANGRTWDGIYPFVVNGTAGPIVTGSETITLNNSFWTRIDYLFNSAKTQGITCFLNLGLSYDFGSTNVFPNLSTTQANTFGNLLSTRYPQASYPNVFWFYGDDGVGNQDTFFSQMLSGSSAAGDTRALISTEYDSEVNSHIEFDTGAVYVPGGFGMTSATYNWVYTYTAPYLGIEKSWTETGTTLLPAMWGDGPYYGDNTGGSGAAQSLKDYTIRRFTWWALASGARGFNSTSGPSGGGDVWQWQANAVTDLTSDPNGTWITGHLAGLVTYFTGLADWHKLVPDTSNVFLIAGRGTRGTNGIPASSPNYGDTDNYVAGSITPAGTLAVLYCGQAFTVTIDQSKLGSGYTATWVDPWNLATTPATTGATYSSGALGNNSAGNPDWALVFQGPAVVPPPPAYANPGRTWLRHFKPPQQPVLQIALVAAVNANAGLATATGTALGQDTGADIAMVSPNAGLAAATGAALGQDTGADVAAVSSNAGLPAATGTALGQDTGADVASVAANAGLAAATGAALGATVQVVLPQSAAYPGAVWRKRFQHPQQPATFAVPAPATNVTGGLAQATGTALGQDTGADIAQVSPNAGLAAATGAGLDATDSLATNGGTAAATGSGQNPGPSIAIGAVPAAATGNALDATVLTVSVITPPMPQVLPGRTWLRQFRHLQQPLPPPPFVAPPFQVARSTPAVAAGVTSSPSVTDPRDGSAGVT